MKQLSFDRKKRLIRNEQFKAVFATGKRAQDGLLTVYSAENDIPYSRLGVSLGRSTGKAFMRNRLKRLIRESFRLNQNNIDNMDYVVMMAPRWFERVEKSQTPKEAIKKIRLSQVQESFCKLAGKANEKYHAQNDNV